MIHPGSLIRWGALGTLVLLVRAIVRESQEHRAPVILLPPAEKPPARRRRGQASRRTRGDDPADEMDAAEEVPENPAPAGARES